MTAAIDLDDAHAQDVTYSLLWAMDVLGLITTDTLYEAWQRIYQQ